MTTILTETESPHMRINGRLKELKKGQEISFSYACQDNYRGFLIQRTTKKLVVHIFEKNGREISMEINHYKLEYVRSIGEFTTPNPTRESIERMDKRNKDAEDKYNLELKNIDVVTEYTQPQQKKKIVVKKYKEA